MEQGGAASGAEPIAVVIKRVFQGVASIQDQITLPVAPTSKVEQVISRAAERNFPALYCLIRAATGERLDEKQLELLELRRVRRVQNVGRFYVDRLAPAQDLHSRPDVVRPTLVDETVPVTRVIGQLAAKLELGKDGELLGVFTVPPQPGVAWHGLDPDATLRELDPHAALTLVLRPILLRDQAPPPALLRDHAAGVALLASALRTPGAAPVPLALALGAAPAPLLARLVALLLATDARAQADPAAALPAWLWHAVQHATAEAEGGATPRNMYLLVRCLAEASGERASRFAAIVQLQETARRLFLLACARSQAPAAPRLAALHSDLLTCVFRHVGGAAGAKADESARLVRWVMGNGEALRRRLWSHVNQRHTSLAKRDRPDVD